jgi:murein DD-endopeptidase MepM/ murein hydrolase activator NlpD/beta-lactamase regulating signal transducer with metallopeptidase domain
MISLIWLTVSSFVWGGVLCLAALLLQRNSDLSGRVRQWIWRGAMLLLIAPWVATPLVSLLGVGLGPVAPEPVVASAAAEAAPQETASMVAVAEASPAIAWIVQETGGWAWEWRDSRWVDVIMLAVMLGWIGRFVLAQLSARTLMGIVANSEPAGAGPAREALEAWSARLGLKRRPSLRFAAGNVSPFSYGIFRPVIILPDGLEQRLDPKALDLVVGHECLHVARGDGWLRPLERVVADVMWFNPFAWMMRREADVARELAIDEGVVVISDARRAYARALRDVAGLSAGMSASLPAASMSLAGSGRSLVLRMKRTLAIAKRKPARAAIMAAVALGVAGACTSVGQAMLATPAAAPDEQVGVELAAKAAEPGMIYAPMDVWVTSVRPGEDGLIRLESTATTGPNARCKIEISPIREVSAHSGDMIKAGAPVGRHMANRRTINLENCELDRLALRRLDIKPQAPGQADILFDQTPVAPVAPQTPRGATLPRMTGATAPVLKGEAGRLSGFGHRTDPFNPNKSAFHEGADFGQEWGAPIYTPADGTVTFAGVKATYGRVVEIAMADDYTMHFGHLNSITVKVDDRVKAGDKIGSMGSTGRSTGPHLHVEVRHSSKLYDPETIPGLRLADTIVDGPLQPTPGWPPQTPEIPAPNPSATPIMFQQKATPLPSQKKGAASSAPMFAPMKMRVVSVEPDDKGKTVALEALATEGRNKGCKLKTTAMTDVKVRSGDTVEEGDLVGTRHENSDRYVNCGFMFAQLMLLEGNKEWMATQDALKAAEKALKASNIPATPATPATPPALAAPPVVTMPPSPTSYTPQADAEYWKQFHRSGAERSGQDADLVRVRQRQDYEAPPPLQGATYPVIVSPARVTSGYGNRADPWNPSVTEFHQSVDIAKEKGAAIHAPAAATVWRAEKDAELGNVVVLGLEGGHTIRFGSLDEIKVARGDKVVAGAVIGTMGRSAPRATGPHLHLETFWNGRAYNPEIVPGLTLIGPA